ncbi:Hint domain-containing protein [Paracoccus ravus]|uniref:Hint domain-containing protein n=1 Tax=Paracoccus ravus TaxID=2447760 RepID=UPI00106E44DB|nr:Hint domain-containing protein [Paracoccus ravus]
MPIVDITFYVTVIKNSVVESDSKLITLKIDDKNGDGFIDRAEWIHHIGAPPGHLAGSTTPPALWTGDGTGNFKNGTLYSRLQLSAGTNVKELLKNLSHGEYKLGVKELRICYLAGTMIATPSGERAVETLAAGDLVLTRDHGAQPLVWKGASSVTAQDLNLSPDLRPIRIRAGALGDGLPRRDVDVSPQHRVLVRDEAGEYLISARHLMMAGHPGVGLRPLDGAFELIHLACGRHEILLAEGAPMESFFCGKMAVRALTATQRLTLFAAFPDLASGKNPMEPARPFIKHKDYREILARAAVVK